MKTLLDIADILKRIYDYGWNDHLQGKPYNPLGRDRDALDRVLMYFEGDGRGENENGAQNQFK